MAEHPSHLDQLLVYSTSRKAPNGNHIPANGKTRLENFKAWLTKNGCEILIPGNEWEVLRACFTDGDGPKKTITIWRNKFNELTWAYYAGRAWKDFTSGQTFSYRSVTPKITSDSKSKVLPLLLQRDGTDCVVCGKPLGLDTSIEHLLDRAFGGPHHIANLTLAHSSCNGSLAKCSSLREKVELIIQKRTSTCSQS